MALCLGIQNPYTYAPGDLRMINSEPFPMVKQPYEQTLAVLTRHLGNLGLRVLTTFDLQTDQPFQTGCTCSQHGSGSCGCRMSVLMIYGKNSSPASMVVHGCEGTTWFSLVDNPQQPIEPQLREDIRRIIETVFSA